MDLVVEVFALLLQNDTVSVAVQLLVRQLGGILGVDFAEGCLDGAPRILEIDLVAMQALWEDHCQYWICADRGLGMAARWRRSQSYARGSRARVRVKVRRITYPPWGPYPLPASSCNHVRLCFDMGGCSSELRASSSGMAKRRRVVAAARLCAAWRRNGGCSKADCRARTRHSRTGTEQRGTGVRGGRCGRW